jgi:hypothetical protein
MIQEEITFGIVTRPKVESSKVDTQDALQLLESEQARSSRVCHLSSAEDLVSRVISRSLARNAILNGNSGKVGNLSHQYGKFNRRSNRLNGDSSHWSKITGSNVAAPSITITSSATELHYCCIVFKRIKERLKLN